MERTKTFIPGGRLYPVDINAIEDRAAEMLEGLAAAIPSSHYAGRYYRATDTNELWIDNGTSWEKISGKESIEAGDIKAEAVETSKIKAAAVTSAKLASGAALANLAVHSLPQNLQSPGTPSSGQVYGGAGQTAENTHKAITGLSITTASIISGQVLVVWFSPSITANAGNVVSARLTLDGTETGTTVQTSSSTPAYECPTTVQRFTGLTGTHVLAGQVWGSSAEGGTQTGGSSIYYEIRNS